MTKINQIEIIEKTEDNTLFKGIDGRFYVVENVWNSLDVNKAWADCKLLTQAQKALKTYR